MWCSWLGALAHGCVAIGAMGVAQAPLDRPAVRFGYEQPHISHHKCSNCPQHADNMLAAALVVGFEL